MDITSIENVFRLVDREIWVVTACSPRQRGGLVATWVNLASIDRHHPTVAVGIAINHFTSELIDESSSFGLHLLRPNQTDVAFNFAIGSGRDRDKLASFTAHTEQSGSPILDDCLAWADCQVFYRMNAGDRIYYFADIVAGDVSASAESATRPLTESQFFAAATEEQRTALLDALQNDIRTHRPHYREWREQLTDSPYPGSRGVQA